MPPSIATPTKHQEVENEWKKELDMSPPRPCRGTASVAEVLSLSEVEALMKKDGIEITKYLLSACEPTDKVAQFRNKRKIVYYLYGRKFDKGKPKVERIKRVQSILQSDETMTRMRHVLSVGGDKRAETLSQFWKFGQMSVLLYSNLPGAVTIFAGCVIPYICRLQTSGNCFLQAVSTLLGYKVALGNESERYETQTMDVGKYVQHNFDDNQLYNRVVDNKGGSSRSTLKELVPTATPKTFDVSRPCEATSLARCLDDWGPAVISCFKTDDIFRNGQGSGSTEPYRIPQFDTKDGIDTMGYLDLGSPTASAALDFNNISGLCEPSAKAQHEAVVGPARSEVGCVPSMEYSENSTESDEEASFSFSESHRMDHSEQDEGDGALHAMVLIGYRQEEGNGKFWFLIQNSWKNMTLCEVSADYLCKHVRCMEEQGAYMFIRDTLTSFPPSVDPIKGVAQECSYVDTGDRVPQDEYPEEGPANGNQYHVYGRDMF